MDTGQPRESTPLVDQGLVVGVFGAGVSPHASTVEDLSREISTRTKWIVLTGGTEPVRSSSAVKHRALVGPDDNNRPWIGIAQERDSLPSPASEWGFVFKTRLGHKRNYLEAVLCDAGIAFPGATGTWSEVVAMLCLRKPVLLVGDEWAGDNLWTNDLDVSKPVPGQPLTDGAMKTWTDRAHEKFREDKDFPAIDALIERDVIAEHLTDAHKGLAVLGIDDWRQAIDKLLDLLRAQATRL